MLYESNKNVKDAEDVTDWYEMKHVKDMKQIADEIRAIKKEIEETN